jgi:hypothetical protein
MLTGFMSGLSKKNNLSKSYINHSIRATGATLLSRNQFGAAQIISVTGIAQYVCNYVWFRSVKISNIIVNNVQEALYMHAYFYRKFSFLFIHIIHETESKNRLVCKIFIWFHKNRCIKKKQQKIKKNNKNKRREKEKWKKVCS